MDTRYRAYLRECVRAAYESWKRHEEATVIGVALASLLGAIISTLIVPLHFKESLGGALLIGLGFWFVFLLFFGSPYLLWKRQRERVLELEEAQKPRLDVGYRFANSYAELIVTNSSDNTVRDVGASLRNVRNVDGSTLRDTFNNLKSVDGDGPRVDLHPGLTAYFKFARLEVSSSNDRLWVVVTRQDGQELWYNEVWAKLYVFGEDCRTRRFDYLLTPVSEEEMRIERRERASNPNDAAVWAN